MSSIATSPRWMGRNNCRQWGGMSFAESGVFLRIVVLFKSAADLPTVRLDHAEGLEPRRGLRTRMFRRARISSLTVRSPHSQDISCSWITA